MMIKKNAPDMDEPKTLKVSLPTKMHLQLHQLKIISGVNISDMVEEALVSYFDELKDSDESVEAQVSQAEA